MDTFIIDSEEALLDFNDAVKCGEVVVHNVFVNTIHTSFGSIEVLPEFLHRIDFGISESDKLIYGKNPTKNIVNISYKSGNVHIFREELNGIKEDIIPFNRYVLAPIQSTGTIRLNGNTHFKYLKEYSDDESFLNAKKNSYKAGLMITHFEPEAFMTRYGLTYFKNLSPKDVSILSFDIETGTLDPKHKNAKVYIITNTLRKNGTIIRKTFSLKNYKSDTDMIQDWCQWVNIENPSIMLGHNIVMFDLEYLHARHGNMRIGRDNSPMIIEDRTRELRKDGSQSYSYQRKSIFGREIIDTFFLAIKYDIGRKYESYGLKSIIKQEGLEKEDRTFIDPSKTKQYFDDTDDTNWNLLLKYAEEDSDDALKLYDLMISATFYSTQIIPKTFQHMIESATGSQLNQMMVRSYLQDGFSVAKGDNKTEYEGAISIGVPGIYRNAIKHDISSLYPSIMLEYKIENKLKDFNGNFQKILSILREERLKNKTLAKETGIRKYDDLQNSQKTNINSLYGFLGAPNLNYNYPEGASLVTKHGREILTKAIKYLTGNDIDIYTEKSVIPRNGRFVLVNADTDSYTVCKIDNSEINDEENKSILNEINGLYPKNISWEDDGVYKFICVLKAKNYILYDGKKIKTKGSSLRDQKKESMLKKMVEDIILDLVHNDGKNSTSIYTKYIKLALNPTDIKEWSQKKTITKPILECAKNSDARKQEMDIWIAIKDTQHQEGDKIYVYPNIVSLNRTETILKNGKVKIKEDKVVGLKLADNYNNDHDTDRLVNRVYDTLCIFENIIDMNNIIDYTLVKNKFLLEDLCIANVIIDNQ